MNELFRSFQSKINDRSLKMTNALLNKCIYNFKYFLIQDDHQIIPRITNSSKIIIVDVYDNLTDKYFIICFSSTLLIILETELHKIQNIFRSDNSTVFFIKKDIKLLFLNQLGVQNYHSNIKMVDFEHDFDSEIESFSDKLILKTEEDMDFFSIICRSISGYFIKQSYIKSNIDRIEKYKEMLETPPKEFIIQPNEYIHLRNIGGSNLSHIELLYHIQREELFCAKIIFDSEEPKLYQREIDNYLNCYHPFLSKYYGTIINGEKKYLGIEYVQGLPLSRINELNLDFYDKVRIVFEITIALQYIHSKGYIYRDLKPNNIIINKNKISVIIDFDRMIIDQKENTRVNSTIIFDNEYGSPELLNGEEYSKESDIYSLGKIIYFIFFQNKNQTKENPKIIIDENDYLIILNIYEQLIQQEPSKRSKINSIFRDLFNYIESKYFKVFENDEIFLKYWSMIAEYSYRKALNILGIFYMNVNAQKGIHYLTLASDYYNDKAAQFNLGNFYKDGKYISHDINKTIKYYSLSANNDFVDAQLALGDMYYSGDKVEKNYNKAIEFYSKAANQNDYVAQYKLGVIYSLLQNPNLSIYYLTLSADQNYSYAQFNLGMLYFHGHYIQRDINKAIEYFTKSANQNNPVAQLHLGNLYSEGKFVKKDLYNAIYYYELAASQNEPDALFQIGIVYYEGVYVKQDINKGLDCLIRASNLNNLPATNTLGYIYYYGINTTKNINLAISYWTKAANENYSTSQYNLGMIYYEGKLFPRDIKKSIYFLEKASKQNHSGALYYLGVIYYEGKYIEPNVEKAIKYLTLSSKLNHLESLNYLGFIYYEGKNLKRDINLSIYYLTKAADQNYKDAQYNLGYIYYNENHIEKSIEYYMLAAKQNHPKAQYFLGFCYFNGIEVKKDMYKAFQYFSESAKQNIPESIGFLGYYYITGNVVKQDINKGIKYVEIAAHENHLKSQFDLGLIYYQGFYVPQNIKKALYYLKQAAGKYNTEASYLLGNIYYEGKYVMQDINEAIKYYKIASSFNCNHAKNNLGIIYKHGFGVKKNISYASELFLESIQKANDPVSMYNLSHLYFFERSNINDSIKFAIKSIRYKFSVSKCLLALILITKHKPITLDIIENEISCYIDNKFDINLLKNEIYTFIKFYEIENIGNYSNFYEITKKEDYVYDHYQPVLSTKFEEKHNKIHNQNQKESQYEINAEFYEGFGFDLQNV